jgi:DICT domain-containing protein/signal transduction histidine kinase
LRSQVYYKSTLTALSHAMEDLVLAGNDRPLVLANFQQERYYRPEARRYQRIAQRTDQIYVLAAPESAFSDSTLPYPTIALNPADLLAQEWHLIIISPRYSACLVCQEFASPVGVNLDAARQFKGIWTFDRSVSNQAARLLLDKISDYRPDLAEQVQSTKQQYDLTSEEPLAPLSRVIELDAKLFTDRLVTYLQSSQYKQIRTYRTIATQERKERLINAITLTIRNSVKLEEIFSTTVREIGQIFPSSRCLLYRHDRYQPIEYEYVTPTMESIRGTSWALAEHPLFQSALSQRQTIAIADINQDLGLRAVPNLQTQLQQWQIGACLLVPICYQQWILGILELHQPTAQVWHEADIALLEAIATQVGVSLIQAKAYDNLALLNQQLVDLERTQSNLIAIVGHELRTPLSTIQVCLESLSTDPGAPLEMRQIMLDTALGDSERLRRLIQDFLTLSRLESGIASWQFEAISVTECLELALSSTDPHRIKINLPADLPLVQADGEGLIEVFGKLLDNACKFSDPDSPIAIEGAVSQSILEISIIDTGRGIEPDQLETIFDRFYQSEGYLQRTVGRTGLGLAICRRIVQKWGGTIRAESPGKMQGSTFRFTLPVLPLA